MHDRRHIMGGLLVLHLDALDLAPQALQFVGVEAVLVYVCRKVRRGRVLGRFTHLLLLLMVSLTTGMGGSYITVDDVSAVVLS